jgi:hypothetical protein
LNWSAGAAMPSVPFSSAGDKGAFRRNSGASCSTECTLEGFGEIVCRCARRSDGYRK